MASVLTPTKAVSRQIFSQLAHAGTIVHSIKDVTKALYNRMSSRTLRFLMALSISIASVLYGSSPPLLLVGVFAFDLTSCSLSGPRSCKNRNCSSRPLCMSPKYENRCDLEEESQRLSHLSRREFTSLGSAGWMLAQGVGSAGAADGPSSEIAFGGRYGTIPEWTLQGGVQMPTLALNTVGLSVEDTTRAVELARKNGITHIDFHPGKERDGVAQYLQSNNYADRDNLFLNTKIRKAPPGTTPEEAAKRTRDQIQDDLKSLGLKSVDMLMLRDSPDCDVIQAQWAVLEDALKKGQTRSIGVINFCESALQCVLETSSTKPAVNYFM